MQKLTGIQLIFKKKGCTCTIKKTVGRVNVNLREKIGTEISKRPDKGNLHAVVDEDTAKQSDSLITANRRIIIDKLKPSREAMLCLQLCAIAWLFQVLSTVSMEQQSGEAKRHGQYITKQDMIPGFTTMNRRTKDHWCGTILKNSELFSYLAIHSAGKMTATVLWSQKRVFQLLISSLCHVL